MSVPTRNPLTERHTTTTKVPTALLLAFLPHAYAAQAAGKNFDVAQPRNSLDNCEKDSSLDKKVRLLFASAHHCVMRYVRPIDAVQEKQRTSLQT